MALVAFGKLGGDEFWAGVLGHLVVEAGDQRVVERALAGDVAGFQNRRADGHVGAGKPHALIDAAGGVADGEAEVPEQIEDELDDALAPRRLLVGQQEEQIDVGARRQRSAAIAADRHHRHVFGGAARAGEIDVAGGEAKDGLDDRVLQGRQVGGAGRTLAVLLEARLGGGTALGQHLLDARHDGDARLRRQEARLTGELGQLGLESLATDRGFGSGKRLGHGARDSQDFCRRGP